MRKLLRRLLKSSPRLPDTGADEPFEPSCLLVGLGNPGEKYIKTRHNIGFWVLDGLARRLDVAFRLKQDAMIAEALVENRNVLLIKPHTYMNRSGQAVGFFQKKFAVDFDRIFVVYDDFNIPFGRLRLRKKGSDGGHNGIRSIIWELETEEFPRLRVGIGLGSTESPVDFVLSDFSKGESSKLPEIVETAVDACLTFIVEGIDSSMNKYNSNPNRGGASC